MKAHSSITCVIAATLLLAGCGESETSVQRTEVSQAGPARLNFHVTLLGADVPDATVTLLAPDDSEIAGFEGQTDAGGFIRTTEIDDIPSTGFTARACVTQVGMAQPLCLYAVWHQRPIVAALVTINEATTLERDPTFKACPSGLCTPDLPRYVVDFDEDPYQYASPAEVDVDRNPSWISSVKEGLGQIINTRTLLTGVFNSMVSMGINKLFAALFPAVDPSVIIIDKLNVIVSMLSQIQKQVSAQFDTLTQTIHGIVADQTLRDIKNGIDLLSQKDSNIAAEIASYKDAGQAALLKDLRDTYLPQNTAKDYTTVTQARDNIRNSVHLLFSNLAGRDPWTKGGKPSGLYSAQYSTNLYTIYVSILAALAQAQDIDTRVYELYMTMIDADGNVCECTNAQMQPCVGSQPGCTCGKTCTRVTDTQPSLTGLNYNLTDPTQPNPLVGIYDDIYRAVRQEFLAALGIGVPNFLVMSDPGGRRPMLAPYLAQPKSLADSKALQMPLDQQDFAHVIWNLDTPSSDPDGKILALNLNNMKAYDDWQVARYNPEQYVIDYFMQIGALSGVDVLANNGVRLGQPANTTAGHLWAKDSEWGGDSIMWAEKKVNDEWRGFYPANLQCWVPSKVSKIVSLGQFGDQCSHESTQNVTANWFTSCNSSYGGTACGRPQRHCNGLPDDANYVDESTYDQAIKFCGKGPGQYGNHDFNVTSLPLYGFPTTTLYPTTIGRTWRANFTDGGHVVTMLDGGPVSDTTIATRITPVMWCPVALNHQAFVSVELTTAAGLGTQPVAVCTYADGSQAVFDTRINGYILVDKAKSSPYTIVSPYNAKQWQGTTCADADSAQCPFVFVDPGKY